MLKSISGLLFIISIALRVCFLEASNLKSLMKTPCGDRPPPPRFWNKRSEVCSTIPSTKAARRSMNRKVVFGGFGRLLEVLGGLLSSRNGRKCSPKGSLECPEALPRGHLGSESILAWILCQFWQPFGSILGLQIIKKPIWVDSKSQQLVNTLLEGVGH